MSIVVQHLFKSFKRIIVSFLNIIDSDLNNMFTFKLWNTFIIIANCRLDSGNLWLWHWAKLTYLWSRTLKLKTTVITSPLLAAYPGNERNSLSSVELFSSPTLKKKNITDCSFYLLIQVEFWTFEDIFNNSNWQD